MCAIICLPLRVTLRLPKADWVSSMEGMGFAFAQEDASGSRGWLHMEETQPRANETAGSRCGPSRAVDDEHFWLRRRM